MKVTEILTESKETITTFLLLSGYDYSALASRASIAIGKFKTTPTWQMAIGLSSILVPLNSKILEILQDNIWDQFEDDPDVEIVFNQFEDLYNSNLNYLKQIKRR